MNLMFATSNPVYALEYLKESSGKKNLTKENISGLLELVQKDIIRVSDPKYHSGMIIQGKKYKEEYKEKIDEEIKIMQGIS